MRQEKTASMIEVNKKFGENLSKLRESSRITHKEIADIIGLSENTVRYYEKGDRTPNLETLLKLSEIFNVSVDELLTGKEISKKRIESIILNYRFAYDLVIAEQFGIEKISADNESELKFSFPVDKRLDELPQSDGKVKFLKSVQMIFSDVKTFCNEFEKWLLAAVSESKTFPEIISEHMKNEYLKSLTAANSVTDSN